MSELQEIGERYRLDGLVVSDGAQSVYRGTDTRSGEVVSIELVHGEIREEAFLETARTLQSLGHPGLPGVLDFGFTEEKSPYLVTDHVHGPSLEDLAGAAPGRLFSLLLVLADCLEALHESGISVPGLRPVDVLVVRGVEGERIRLRGLGRAVPEEGNRDTLRSFALLAARLLRISTDEVGIPLELAVELRDPAALRAFLKAALAGDPEGRYDSFREVRKALIHAFLEGDGDGFAPGPTETRPDLHTLVKAAEEPTDWKTKVFVPPPPPPVSSDSTVGVGLVPARVGTSSTPTSTSQFKVDDVPVPPPPARSRRRLFLTVGAIAAAVILAGASFLLGRHASEPPIPASAPAARSAPAPRIPAASPSPVDPAPVAAEAAPEALVPLPPEQLARDLARALETGDPRRLRAVVASIPAAEQAALPAGIRKDLARAKRVLDADARLTRAQRAGNPAEVIVQASALLQEVPGALRVAAQREKAAAGLESEANEAIGAGQFDLALSRLQVLRQAWPERDGVDERIESIRAERKADQDLEAVLTSATRAERTNRPLEGLAALAEARPNRRLASRFQQTRERLEAQLAQLDSRPPELALRGGSEVTYEKGKSARIPLRITDDHGVKLTEVWARAEGGRFERVAVRQVSGADYEAEVSPELHGNRTVELYAVAADHSGHAGQLGSADRPLKVKRKRWLDRVLGGKGKEGGEE